MNALALRVSLYYIISIREKHNDIGKYRKNATVELYLHVPEQQSAQVLSGQ